MYDSRCCHAVWVVTWDAIVVSNRKTALYTMLEHYATVIGLAVASFFVYHVESGRVGPRDPDAFGPKGPASRERAKIAF